MLCTYTATNMLARTLNICLLHSQHLKHRNITATSWHFNVTVNSL
jgi:hypothetical protein